MFEVSHIHFETRAGKPDVFRMTAQQIEDAKLRSATTVKMTLGHDLEEMAELVRTSVLVTSNDIVRDPAFPMRDLASAAPHLRWIHIIGAGIEPLLPLDWLPEGCVLTNNSGVHVAKATESAAMVLLMLNSRIPAMATNQRAACWDQIFTTVIRGKTALVIGVGDMGGAAAAAARSLGLYVIGVRRTPVPHTDVDEMIAIANLDTALPRADFVVVATPATPETTKLIDARRISLMRPGAGIFNFGRAACIDHDALTAALESGHLSGAVVDVFDAEPLESSSPLWHARNLMLMPHVSSDDAESYLPKTYDLVFENLRRIRAGEPMLNVVDPARGY